MRPLFKEYVQNSPLDEFPTDGQQEALVPKPPSKANDAPSTPADDGAPADHAKPAKPAKPADPVDSADPADPATTDAVTPAPADPADPADNADPTEPDAVPPAPPAKPTKADLLRKYREYDSNLHWIAEVNKKTLLQKHSQWAGIVPKSWSDGMKWLIAHYPGMKGTFKFGYMDPPFDERNEGFPSESELGRIRDGIDWLTGVGAVLLFFVPLHQASAVRDVFEAQSGKETPTRWKVMNSFITIVRQVGKGVTYHSQKGVNYTEIALLLYRMEYDETAPRNKFSTPNPHPLEPDEDAMEVGMFFDRPYDKRGHKTLTFAYDPPARRLREHMVARQGALRTRSERQVKWLMYMIAKYTVPGYSTQAHFLLLKNSRIHTYTHTQHTHAQAIRCSTCSLALARRQWQHTPRIASASRSRSRSDARSWDAHASWRFALDWKGPYTEG
jgi:hypothetical protein